MRTIHVVGAGPAGSSAALAALAAGAGVALFDKSRFPRHKVCGEFLSPELGPLLADLGVSLDAAATIRRMTIHLRRRSRTAPLPEAAWGLSRYRFDELLIDRAMVNGARLLRESQQPAAGQVWAAGRQHTAPRGGRLFGFKAHYSGPADDSVELFFFPGGYAGLNAIENGLTNLCGLADEETLSRFDFDCDALVAAHGPLAERTRPLTREMPWLTTGPLAFKRSVRCDMYVAGDALSFVDPFTGSGLLNAVLTGKLAGECAATGTSVSEYVRRCRCALDKPFRFAGWLRQLAGTKLADAALPLVPAGFLFRHTRPAT